VDLTKIVSQAFAQFFADKSFSRRVIPLLERYYNIDTSLFEKNNYKTLNDWFKRDLRNINFSGELSSSCEAFLKVHRNLNPSYIIQAKNKSYQLPDLLGNLYSESFIDGTMLVFRLEPRHYHNFHHIVDGKVSAFQSLDGNYLPVNALGLNHFNNLYCRNRRDITLVQSELGNIAYVEIGALNVGSIVQLNNLGDNVKKGDKKGYFQFGGSTVLVLFEKDRVQLFDQYNEQEKYVFVGEQIGQLKKIN